MRYEILENNQVINTIEADESFMTAQFQPGTYRLAAIQITAPEPISIGTKITQLAFLNRFTDAEAIAIDLASQGTTVEAASMRRYQKKVDAASFIDLSRQDTRDGVIALETAGLLAPGRATQILDTPVTSEEIPRG